MTRDILEGILLLMVFTYSVVASGRTTPQRLLPQKVVFAVTGGVMLLFVYLFHIEAVDGMVPGIIMLVASVPALGSAGWICVDHLRARARRRAAHRQGEAPAAEPHRRLSRRSLRNFANRPRDPRKRLTCPSCAWEFTMGGDLKERSRLPCPACGELHAADAYQGD